MLPRATAVHCFLSWEEMFLHRSEEMQPKGNAILTNFKGGGEVLFFFLPQQNFARVAMLHSYQTDK